MRTAAEGAERRAPLIASGIVLASLTVLALAIFTNSATVVTPIVAFTLLCAIAYRLMLRWTTLLAAIVVVILFIPIRRYTAPGNLPFELEPYRILVAFTITGWLASLLVDPRVRLRRSGFEGPLLVFVAAALGSVIVNMSRVSDLGVESFVTKRISFFASFLLVFYFIVSIVRTRQEIDLVTKVLVAGGAVLAVFALIEARTGFNIFQHLSDVIPFLKLNAGLDETDIARGARLRTYASAQHPIALGALFAMLTPIAIYVARTYGQRRWLFAGGLMAIAAVSTLSRTSILMLITVALVFVWLRPREIGRLWPAIVPLVIVIHLALPGSLGTLKEAFFPPGGLVAEQQSFEGTPGSGRLADVGPSLDQFARQPVLGQGFGTRVVEGEKQNAAILDNQWLGTLLEMGVIGVFAIVWLYLRFLRRLGRAGRRHTPEGFLAISLASSIAAYAVSMFTFDSFTFIQVTFLLFVVLGLAAALLEIPERWLAAVES